MKSVLIEEGADAKKAYESLILEPRHLGILSNPLPLRLLQELSKTPACALDLSRSLNEHEQKIYYYLRKLETAGMVKLLRTEKRFGMTAKIYDAVSPVVAAKLFEKSTTFQQKTPVRRMNIQKFLSPFIHDGKMNALFILGSPHPHGKFEATARDSVYINDLMLFMGTFIEDMDNVSCKLDTEVSEFELKNNNIVLFGNPKINTITQRVNSALPIYFDEARNFSIFSTVTQKSYDYDTTALILRTRSPFNEQKELLLIAGIRSQAIRTAVVGILSHSEKIMEGNSSNRKIHGRILLGIDRGGTGKIDSVKFLE